MYTIYGFNTIYKCYNKIPLALRTAVRKEKKTYNFLFVENVSFTCMSQCMSVSESLLFLLFLLVLFCSIYNVARI